MVVSMMTSRKPPFVSDDPLSSYLRDRGSDPSVDLTFFWLSAVSRRESQPMFGFCCLRTELHHIVRGWYVCDDKFIAPTNNRALSAYGTLTVCSHRTRIE
jgi:hypothetical protein